MIGKRFLSLPFIFANDNYTLSFFHKILLPCLVPVDGRFCPCYNKRTTQKGVFCMTDTIKFPNLTLRYSFIQGFYWMNFSAIMGFASLYLLDSGFSNTEIGMIMAVAGIISAILQPIIAGYADHPSSPSLKKIVLTLTLIQMILGVLMLLSFRKSILFTGILYGSTITLLQLLNPFINSLGMESINQGKALNFGAARGMGSVAYAIMSYILGAIAEKAGAVSVPLSIAVLSLGFIGILVLFPFHKTAVAVSVRKPAASSPLAFFIKYKRFAVVLIGCIFIYLSHVLLNSFTFQIVESKGGGSAEMGTAMAIAALIELPTLFLFTFMCIFRSLRARCTVNVSNRSGD